jgi:hypothetical protein
MRRAAVLETKESRSLRCELADMSRFLIVVGLVLVVLGLLWPLLTRTGIGRLPGDIVVERGNFSFYFPAMTSIVVRVVVILVLRPLMP